MAIAADSVITNLPLVRSIKLFEVVSVSGCAIYHSVTVRKESVIGYVIGNSINAPRLFGTADRAHLSSRPNIICNNPVSKDSGSHDYLLHALPRKCTILRDSRKTQLCARSLDEYRGRMWHNINKPQLISLISFMLIWSTCTVIDSVQQAQNKWTK